MTSQGSKRRFESHTPIVPGARGLAANHPALTEKRTIFPSTVVNASDSPRLLVSGHNQRKIGDRVSKGRWRGMPIFCLTLEERATCPESCHHWHDCYGNNMHRARRHRHGYEFESILHREIENMQYAHPGGFVVRTHILGDFYSTNYVDLWFKMLNFFPALRMYGYTAHGIDTEIGKEVNMLNACFDDRVWIRFSRKWPSDRVISAITIPNAEYPTDAIVCPAQTDKTECCGTCGLCWSTDKTIAFLQHGGFTPSGKGVKSRLKSVAAAPESS